MNLNQNLEYGDKWNENNIITTYRENFIWKKNRPEITNLTLCLKKLEKKT